MNELELFQEVSELVAEIKRAEAEMLVAMAAEIEAAGSSVVWDGLPSEAGPAPARDAEGRLVFDESSFYDDWLAMSYRERLRAF